MKKNAALIITLAVIFVASVILAFCFGSTGVSIKEFIAAVAAGDKSSVGYRIFMYVRAPRVFAAMLSGAALAVSGVILQGALGNPLAGPNIIGVNSGAGLGAFIAMAIFPVGSGIVSVSAFIGALFATLLIFLIASKSGAGKVTVVLAGVAVSSTMSAGIDVIKTVFTDIAVDGNSFLVGGFSGVTMVQLAPASVMIPVGLLLAVFMAKAVDIMGLGDDTARSLGMNVKANRFVLIVCASVLAGTAVSFSGLLGFVGLIVPHIIRRFTGNSHRILIPAAALGGASFVILCDLLARVLFAPYEIPVGIVMSFIGAPFFLFLLLTKHYN